MEWHLFLSAKRSNMNSRGCRTYGKMPQKNHLTLKGSNNSALQSPPSVPHFSAIISTANGLASLSIVAATWLRRRGCRNRMTTLSAARHLNTRLFHYPIFLTGVWELLSFGPRPKQSRSDADNRRAFLDGHVEISCHAHAQMRQASAGDLLAALFQLAQATEKWPHFLRLGCPGRHGHQTADFQSPQRLQPPQLLQQWLGPIAELGAFAADVDFQEKGQGLGGLLRALVQFLGQVKAINTLDQLDQLHRVATLIGLQMSDHVPAQAAWAQRNFRLRLLHFVFTEERQAQCRRLAHDLRRLVLGHRKQSD